MSLWSTAGWDKIAHYLDARGNELPIVLCESYWENTEPKELLTDSEKTLLLMNRSDLVYREADCSRSLLLAAGGARQRVVLFTEENRNNMHPYLREWLSHGQPAVGKLPRDTVFELELTALLADRAGEFTTMAPVWYDPDFAGEAVPIPPPIRFGENLTFLGYEPNVARTFMAGETVDVITYWRAEGMVPADLTLFTHILSDPVTLINGRDVIGVNPARLRDRDVFIQVTSIPLPKTTLAGEYFVSVGAYRQTVTERLSAYKDDQPYGDRIFLYSIEVQEAPNTEERSN